MRTAADFAKAMLVTNRKLETMQEAMLQAHKQALTDAAALAREMNNGHESPVTRALDGLRDLRKPEMF